MMNIWAMCLSVLWQTSFLSEAKVQHLQQPSTQPKSKPLEADRHIWFLIGKKKYQMKTSQPQQRRDQAQKL